MQDSDPEEMDIVSSTFGTSGSSTSTADSSPKAGDGASAKKEEKEGKKSALKRYIDSFDAETTKQMTSIMSIEAARLLSRQSKALWGDLEELTVELREVCVRGNALLKGEWCNIAAQYHVGMHIVAFSTLQQECEQKCVPCRQ